MAYCIKCGKLNADASKFCTGCGATLETKEIVHAETKAFATTARRKTNTVLIAVIALLAIGAGAYFLFFNKKKKEERVASGTIPGRDTTTVAPTERSTVLSTEVGPNPNLSYTDIDGRLVYRSDCYVIVTGSFADESYARSYAASMKNQGNFNTGYLWIPDFPSLSGKPFFATFIGPYQTYADCENSLRALQVNSRFWYGKKVSYNPEQIEIRIK